MPAPVQSRTFDLLDVADVAPEAKTPCGKACEAFDQRARSVINVQYESTRVERLSAQLSIPLNRIQDEDGVTRVIRLPCPRSHCCDDRAAGAVVVVTTAVNADSTTRSAVLTNSQ